MLGSREGKKLKHLQKKDASRNVKKKIFANDVNICCLNQPEGSVGPAAHTATKKHERCERGRRSARSAAHTRT